MNRADARQTSVNIGSAAGNLSGAIVDKADDAGNYSPQLRPRRSL